MDSSADLAHTPFSGLGKAHLDRTAEAWKIYTVEICIWCDKRPAILSYFFPLKSREKRKRQATLPKQDMLFCPSLESRFPNMFWFM